MISHMHRTPQREVDSIGQDPPVPVRTPEGGAPAPGLQLDAERIALGHALLARADEVGRLVGERFAQDLQGHALVAATLGTELIGRWLVTDQAASTHDEEVLAQQGELALTEDAVLASVAKAYFAWRDITLMILEEEGRALGVGDDLLTLATTVVRLSCDGSLVRIVRQFDETRRSLQRRLDEEQATLAHQALHDVLTGLPNRTLLLDRLSQAASSMVRRRTSAVLLFLDLDNFKAINDRFGHAAGDRLLVEVAARLQSLVRAGDTVARLGGDEFVVLAQDLDETSVAADSLAERIHLAMRAPVLLGERQLYSSVSIGISPVTPDVDPEVCLAQADAAMYQAKRGGPARFETFNPVIGEDNQRRSQLAHELRAAHELGQLVIHYQPLIKVGGDVVGMEALLRWRHPELGAVSPIEFIPLLEHSREIVPIGRWVLDEAAHQCRIWQDQGRVDLSISVNVSARQLQDPGFVDHVRGTLVRSRLAPASLVLEMTESALIADVPRIGAVLQQVRDLGVHVALDDFGTGYSSLLYLKGLPIDRIKVDRSFVSGLGASEHDPGIIAMVVDLAHRLGLKVVAEGVETDAELRAVGEMGCDEAQGYLLGRPAPAHSYTAASMALSHT
jgi:diguanylate cyclase (GGDEF)-like protein